MFANVINLDPDRFNAYYLYIWSQIEPFVAEHKGSTFPDVGLCNESEFVFFILHTDVIWAIKYNPSLPNPKDPGVRMLAYVIDLKTDVLYRISMLYGESHRIPRYRTRKMRVSTCWHL